MKTFRELQLFYFLKLPKKNGPKVCDVPDVPLPNLAIFCQFTIYYFVISMLSVLSHKVNALFIYIVLTVNKYGLP